MSPTGTTIVSRPSFACCVWNGKILVAGGYTELSKSISKAEIYDPDTDTWDPIPDLDQKHNSPCEGFVIDGAVHVVNLDSKEVHVLESLEDTWRRSHSLKQGLITVVNGSLYVMTYAGGHIYKLEHGIWKFVVSALEFNNRFMYDIMGFRDDIYVFGGVVMPDRGSCAIKKVSDVDVLLLGNKNEKPVWKKVASMTRCQGYIHGCPELRI